MRVLAIDPGSKWIGIAVSDPTGTIARPLAILKHLSQDKDVHSIIELAKKNEASKIIIGHSLDDEGLPNSQSQSAERLAKTIRSKTNIPVEFWDETGSTKVVQKAWIQMGVPRRKRRSRQDDLAATYILQSYLDAHSDESSNNTVF